MTLRFATDRSGIRWFEKAVWDPRLPGGVRVGTWVPEGYEAYARVLHAVTGPDGRRIRWSDLAGHFHEVERLFNHHQLGVRHLPFEPPPGGEPSESECRALIPRLAAATTTVDDIWFAMWDGYGWWNDAPVAGLADGPGVPPGPLMTIPAPPALPTRHYFVYRGGLSDVRGFRYGRWGFKPPNIWWPADQAWVVHSEIDTFWTLVGGTRALIDALHAVDDLEVLDASVDETD